MNDRPIDVAAQTVAILYCDPRVVGQFESGPPLPDRSSMAILKGMAILTGTIVSRRPSTRRTFELGAAEQINVKRSLRVIRGRLGGWRAVARKLGCSTATVHKAAGNGKGKGTRPSAALALRTAQLMGISVEALISGAWFRDQTCPLCGRKG